MFMINSLNIQLLCHATEDEGRIKKRVEKFFGITFSSESLKGHFDNPITLLKVDLKKKEASRILNLIKPQLKFTNFEKKSDKGKFFFRLSKIDLFKNEIKEGNDVRFRVGIQTFPANGKEVEKVMRKFWKA